MIKILDKVAIMNKARIKYQCEHNEKIKRQAEASFERYKNDPLFIAGIMLYWAEGKTTYRETCNLELLNIPLSQFIKSYVSKSRSSVTKSKLKYGTCSLYITSKELRITMGVWIEKFIDLYMRG